MQRARRWRRHDLKLGVYSVLFGLVELAAKVLFFGTGLFLLVWGGRWVLRRRQAQPVRWSVEPLGHGVYRCRRRRVPGMKWAMPQGRGFHDNRTRRPREADHNHWWRR